MRETFQALKGHAFPWLMGFFLASVISLIFAAAWKFTDSFGFLQEVSLTNIHADSGLNYIGGLPDNKWSSEGGPSAARLLENGKPLEFGNAMHDDIRTKGHGRFSFWGDNVYFSSSDGSNPLTNGYVYTVQGPLPLPALFWPLDISCLILSITFLLFFYPGECQASFSAISLHADTVLSNCLTTWFFYILTIVSVLFAILMIINPSITLSDLSLSGNLWLLFLFALIIGICLLLPDKVRIMTVIGFVFSGLVVFLSIVWASHATSSFVIGGIIPHSDANNYYQEASRLIEGSNLTNWGTRRPFTGAFFAAVLFMSGHSLPITNATIVGLTAVALAFLILEIRQSVGILPATVVTFICLSFYIRFVGLFLSEQWGLLLGCLGLALLLHGISGQRKWISVGGLFTLTLALNARAGAFFVLPTIALALAWQSPGSRAKRIKVLFLAFGAVILGFLVNYFFVKTLGAKEGLPFANFSYTLYGLVFGGDWTTAYKMPEFVNLPEREREVKIYYAAIQAIKDNPQLLLNGIWRALKGFILLDPHWYGPFAFVGRKGIGYVLQFASGAGAVYSVATARRNRISGLIAFAVLGIILSIPFAPPWDADNMRAYAATIPIAALLPGMALSAGLQFLHIVFLKAFSLTRASLAAPLHVDSSPSPGRPLVVLYSGAIMTLFLILPFISRFALKTEPLAIMSNFNPQTNKEVGRFNLKKGNYIRLVDKPSAESTWHDITVSDFLKSLEGISVFFKKDVSFLESVIRPGITIFAPGNFVMCIINSTHLNSHKNTVEVKGKIYVRDTIFFVEESIVRDADLGPAK